ncbi:hypothetical protein [Tabrizicola oligotrophica]|uniref:Uncharacterized protein n=1 Tax=Tabrizicola oligotrophica TaxID=2710650 RepID=A0A6M0QUN6_9RHOB|nr:hypothetical protein [Tabrizicola oligotrophica]NEY91145.1 hypothetical protein [Tabrizicola oligotrophica]
MNPKDLSRLTGLAEMMLDHRLAQLRLASEAKARSEAALAGLSRSAPTSPGDLVGASAALAGVAYERWADSRRAEINLVLARQTRHWLDVRDGALEAFGKAEALQRLREKLAR